MRTAAPPSSHPKKMEGRGNGGSNKPGAAVSAMDECIMLLTREDEGRDKLQTLRELNANNRVDTK